MGRRTNRISGGIVAGLIALASHASPAIGQQVPVAGDRTAERDFDIAAQSLRTAILRFSDQANVQWLADVAVMGDVRTHAVKGHMSIAAALDRLLDGTGLSWEMLAKDTITIRQRAAPRPVPAAAPPTENSGPRIFAPVHVEGRRPSDLADAGRYGSSDPTATQGSGTFAAEFANIASKRPRALQDTPQSVSVITSERLKQQNLTDVSAALQQMPGVASRTINGVSGATFLSRGFEIHTFSFDGGGPTFYQSALDADVRASLEAPELAEFDHVEVLRGAAGLFGGIGYPGGVINFQRKRPLDHARLALDLQTGSWKNHRIEADASLPIAFDGRLRARAVAVAQTRDFFYDTTHEDRQFVYGTVEADIGPNILVRAGGSYRDINRPGFNASGLPRYLDGGALGWPRDTCLCPPSNRYGAQQAEQFLSAEWRIGGDWQLGFNGTRRSQNTDYQAGLAYARIARGNVPDYYLFRTGFVDRNVHVTGDVTVSGTIRLAGMDTALLAGVDYSNNRSFTSGFTSHLGYFRKKGTIADVIAAIEANDFNQNGFTVTGQTTHARQYAPYVQMTFPVSDAISIDAGLRKSFYRMDFESEEDGMGNSAIRVLFDQPASLWGPVYPSFALSYKATPELTAHLSYAKIFQPQALANKDWELLPSLSGTSYEIRLHRVNDARSLQMSAAFYYETLQNFPVYIPALYKQPQCCYDAVDSARSYGLDLELTGEVRLGWQVQASYNWNRNTYSRRAITQQLETQQPKHQIKLWTSYALGDVQRRWSFGGGLRIESKRYSNRDNCQRLDVSLFCVPDNIPDTTLPIEFSQPLYAVADLRIGRQFGDIVEASLNINNITDTRYYATVSAPLFGNYFGEPRSFVFSLKTRFGD
jgi:outer membrane receptor for ferric coprogen and ferric-rhodotorulic acid